MPPKKTPRSSTPGAAKKNPGETTPLAPKASTADASGVAHAAKAADVPKLTLLKHINNFFMDVVGPLLIMVSTMLMSLLVAFITNSPSLSSPTLTGLLDYGKKHGVENTLKAVVLYTGVGDQKSWVFLLLFNFFALLVYWWPGPVKHGPITPTGHTPEYMDNGVAHMILTTMMFLGGSLIFESFNLGIIFDVYGKAAGALNVIGLAFCLFLYVKGLYFPCTADSGSSRKGFIFDFYWGTELYPRIGGVDVKKFVNCRFAMTFWQLAGISFAYSSYQRHGFVDPGIVLCAISQYFYLVKFYLWEIGYMRSIDIIVDRAGFYETWGCLNWVPAVYTLHTRVMVRSPSHLSWPTALAIFSVGFLGVILNYWADWQRMRFREVKGDMKIWGRSPKFVRAKYVTTDAATKKTTTHESLLLASGWWGSARHQQYFFELMAAWSWGLLAGVPTNGVLPLLYPAFLTVLLFHREARDEEKCHEKYGEYWEEYVKLVPYRIIPFIY